MHIGLLILCGFLIGFILIFLGMGAALYIGCLITIFHLSAKTAAASALVVTLPALIIGTLINHRTHTTQRENGGSKCARRYASCIDHWDIDQSSNPYD